MFLSPPSRTQEVHFYTSRGRAGVTGHGWTVPSSTVTVVLGVYGRTVVYWVMELPCKFGWAGGALPGSDDCIILLCFTIIIGVMLGIAVCYGR
jgi:hypothetical protein